MSGKALKENERPIVKIGHVCQYCRNDIMSNETIEESADKRGYVHSGFCAHQRRLLVERR